MQKSSAGILPFKFVEGKLLFFIVHPGGPFFKNKDNGAWSIVKGELDDGEDLMTAAKREFLEETSFPIQGELIELDPVVLKSGKKVHCFAVQTEQTFENAKSNYFEITWPPKSTTLKSFPEIDKFEWFNASESMVKLNSAQAALIGQVEEIFRKV